MLKMGNISRISLISLQKDYYYLKYAATMVFDCAVFMAVWVVALLNISNSWMSVGATLTVGLLRAPLKYWQTLIDPYAR